MKTAKAKTPENRGRLARLGPSSTTTRRPSTARKRRQSQAVRNGERNIIDNFRYVSAMIELQGGAPVVRPMKTFRGPLPGIYPRRVR